MQVKELKKNPEQITLVFVEAVLMPNGEIIRNGKSIGWEKELKGVYVKEEIINNMKTKKEIDYYGTDANYIHLKFGNARKSYNFTKDFQEKYQQFAKEYAKYFEGSDTAQFKNPFQIVHYVYKNKIPVYFYYNFTDTPAKNEKEILEYLGNESAYMQDLK